MSWWVQLEDEDGECVPVAPFLDGGMVCADGERRTRLNVTYNYSPHFDRLLPEGRGLSWLDGRRGVDCIAALEFAVVNLGTERSADYWAPTPGNAGTALNRLLGWAKIYPEAIFYVA